MAYRLMRIESTQNQDLDKFQAAMMLIAGIMDITFTPLEGPKSGPVKDTDTEARQMSKASDDADDEKPAKKSKKSDGEDDDADDEKPAKKDPRTLAAELVVKHADEFGEKTAKILAKFGAAKLSKVADKDLPALITRLQKDLDAE